MIKLKFNVILVCPFNAPWLPQLKIGSFSTDYVAAKIFTANDCYLCVIIISISYTSYKELLHSL